MSILNGDDVELMGKRGRRFGRVLAAIATGGLSSKKFRRGLAAVSTGGLSEAAIRLKKKSKAKRAATNAVGATYQDTGVVAPEYQDEVGGMDSYQDEPTDLPNEEPIESQDLESAEMSGDKKKLFLYAGLGVVGAYMLYKSVVKRKKR
jgi:hypothetical protein